MEVKQLGCSNGSLFFEGNHQTTSSGDFEDFFPQLVFWLGDGMSKLHFCQKQQKQVV